MIENLLIRSFKKSVKKNIKMIRGIQKLSVTKDKYLRLIKGEIYNIAMSTKNSNIYNLDLDVIVIHS